MEVLSRCSSSSSGVSQRGSPTPADMASAEHLLAEMQELMASMQQEVALAVEEKRRREEEAAAAAAKKKELQKQQLAKAQVPDPVKQAGRKPPPDGGFEHFEGLRPALPLPLPPAWAAQSGREKTRSLEERLSLGMPVR